MDQELRQLLEWMNANLNAIVANQAMIYEEMRKMEKDAKDEDQKEEYSAARNRAAI